MDIRKNFIKLKRNLRNKVRKTLRNACEFALADEATVEREYENIEIEETKTMENKKPFDWKKLAKKALVAGAAIIFYGNRMRAAFRRGYNACHNDILDFIWKSDEFFIDMAQHGKVFTKAFKLA